MKLVWLSPRWPFPADDGAKQVTSALVLALAEAGHEIHVVAFSRDAHLGKCPHKNVKLLEHYFIPEQGKVARALKSLFSNLPVSVLPFASHFLTWNALKEKLGAAPDAVVIDGAHVFAAVKGSSCPWPILYRAHNVEYSIWKQASVRRKLFSKLFISQQARKMKRMETELCALSKGIAAISPEDKKAFEGLSPGTKVTWVPMGYHFKSSPAFPAGSVAYGFLGRLDWPPNREGLEWFLEKIWSPMKAKGMEAKLFVAGSGDDSWLKKYPANFFERLGKVARVDDFYAKVHVPIAPIQFGGGTKIKVVEAARNARAILATPEAMLGSGLSTSAAALVSADPLDWIRLMESPDISRLRETGQRALQECERLFDADVAASNFLSLLS